MIERWLPIVGYEGLYEVSSEGRVKAIRRSGSPGRILIFRPDAAGYMKLNLYKIGSAKRKCIHRLVLEAFVGPCPEGMEGCHDDGDPGNNRSGNLRWDTPANNNDDKHRHGTILLGERNYATKITVSTVHDIFGLRQLGLSFQKIGNRVGLSRQHVRAILLRQCWKHVDVLSPAAIMRTSK